MSRVKIENARNELNDFTQVMVLIDLENSWMSVNGVVSRAVAGSTKDVSIDWFARSDTLTDIGDKSYGQWVKEIRMCCEDNKISHLNTVGLLKEELDYECSGKKINVRKYSRVV